MVVRNSIRICEENRADAIDYLNKARKLKEEFGSGLATMYCWFYSIPQKWTQVEPIIFKLAQHTGGFDLRRIPNISITKFAELLKPIIFRNDISIQLKRFCRSVRNQYGSWESFAEALENENMFQVLRKLRRHNNIRLTFKNLATMKSFVGCHDNLIILDTHVARVLGLTEKLRSKHVVQEKLFKSLLAFSYNVTKLLERKGFKDLSVIEWSLAIWFNKVGISSNDLLTTLETA